MNDSVTTPLRQCHGLLLDDNSLSCTPNPQATSTAAKQMNYRFDVETQPMIPQDASSNSEKRNNFLCGAIDDLRSMSHQLEAFRHPKSDSEKVPPSDEARSARSLSLASRRSSGAAGSVGNSSLGILNVNELDCDALNVSRTSGVFGESKIPSQAEDTFDWRGFSSRSVLTDSNFARLAPSKNRSSFGDTAADLRSRMQKALALKAINRASEKGRTVFEEDLAQLDSMLTSIQQKPNLPPIPSSEVSSHSLYQGDDSRRSRNSFVAEESSPEVSSQDFPFSPRSSSIPDISKESFVSGEFALNRIEKDQDSWRKNYGCFPTIEPTGDDDRASSISSKLQDVTKNIDLSLSGVVSGDVTISSSLQADTEMRRLSAGEYFGLRSENLGQFDTGDLHPPRESLRPNFGNEIHSPTRVRRVPLVENSGRLSDVSLDKVPTKDTGLDRQSLDSFDFTFDTTTASNRKSTDLMPPPPPPSEQGHRREPTRSMSRRSLQIPTTSSNVSRSKRLSMSMSDVVGANREADVSFCSVDECGRRTSNQTVPSLSHIAQLLSDMSGTISTRMIVDKLMENCSIPPKSRSKSSASDSHSERESDRSNPTAVTPRSKGSGSSREVADEATPTPPKELGGYDISVKQRVTEWMSRADVNAERQHVQEELVTERILASNSPAKTSTPRQSMYSDISSAGLSDGRAPSPRTPANCAPNKGSSSESNGSHSTPMTSSRRQNGLEKTSKVPKISSVRPKVAATVSDSPSSAEVGNSKTPSLCGSATTTRSLSRNGDTSSLSGNSPFQVDSTHTQLSWPSVPLGASKTQSLALKNKSTGRIRLLVMSGNPAFKLLGDRGEIVTELTVSMHCEEARRINVVFSPNACGAVVSRLVISRIGGSDMEQRRERRLIPLYGCGGQAQVNLEGAPKDQWAQWFVNLTYVDGDLSGATFCARNSGDVPAFVQAQICTEGVPFSDCGVSISPTSLTLVPGQSSRFSLRWEPKIEVLEWLSENAGDVHVLANVWLSWAELSTWQRITRLYYKYYKKETEGSLSNWVPCILEEKSKEESEAWQQLKDNKAAESSLVQSVRRIKLAVLGEREMLRGFDLDASVVFQQLTVNDTVLMGSPSGREDIRKKETVCKSSPVLSDITIPSVQLQQHQYSPQLRTPLNYSSPGDDDISNEATLNSELDLTATPVRSDSYVVRFPATIVNHKTCAKITFKNFSKEQHHVAVRGVTEPFQCPTSKFFINGDWYLSLRVFFQPKKAGPLRRLIEIWVDGQYKLAYELVAEGIDAQP